MEPSLLAADGGSPGARSTGQRRASVLNGRRSSGPRTSPGKAVSSMNSVDHGLSAVAWLAPDESVEELQACVRDIEASLQPTSPILSRLVLPVASVIFRQERLLRIEAQLMTAAVETKLKASDAQKSLDVAKDALAAVQGLASLAEGIDEEMEVDRALPLVPAMLTVLDMTVAAGGPGTVTGPLGTAIERFRLATVVEVMPEDFGAVARACRDAEADLLHRIPDLERQLESERVAIARSTLLADSKELRILDRARGRLGKELELALRAYDQARALEQGAQDAVPGSSVGQYRVDLRVVQPAGR